MAVIVADFKEPVVGPDGVEFRARACGLSRATGQWRGWIEFNPLNGAPTFRSPYETEQTSSHGLRQWAGDLTPDYLEDALTRALGRLAGASSRA
jgi:hypothetical protein